MDHLYREYDIIDLIRYKERVSSGRSLVYNYKYTSNYMVQYERIIASNKHTYYYTNVWSYEICKYGTTTFSSKNQYNAI